MARREGGLLKVIQQELRRKVLLGSVHEAD